MKNVFIPVALFILLILLAVAPSVQAGFYPPYPYPNIIPYALPSNPGGTGSSQQALNPLTGLPVQDPDTLLKPPALISITNWPVSARPQAGLSYVSQVFEFSIGDGESRFLGVFYGDLPPEELEITGGTETTVKNTVIGPLRSGRLFYEDLRENYHGNLFMASAYKGVMDNLKKYNNFFGSDRDIISAFVEVKQLKRIANASNLQADPEGMAANIFDSTPPPGGAMGTDLWFIYNAQDQVHWQYDPVQEAYIRYQDLADGTTFVAASDRINQETLDFENVVILSVNHRYCTEYAYELDLQYQDLQPAFIFRDGQVHEVYWTTSNDEYEQSTGLLRPIRFVYKDGTPFPLKPGQTWMHLVPHGTRYWEAPQASDLFSLLNKKEAGSGNWVSRFYRSLMVYDKEVCDRIGYKTD